MNLDNYVTVKDYADANKISVQAVYKKISTNSLTSKKIGKVTLVKKG